MAVSKNTPNRLANEKSPYLLQHAHNPVDWFSWSEEAFQKALSEDKPIFLSIGYSACHWCHKMEEESFNDIKVAEILNRNYVSIKVDKEERPDIDKIYMKACQAINGSGGWPLTIVMTPQEIPFFAATYIPRSTKFGGAGLVEVLNTISSKWLNQRHDLEESGLKIHEHIKKGYEEFNEPEKPDKNTLKNAYYLFAEFFDKENGGFSFAPKFPTPHNLLFLLRYSFLENKKNALKMTEKTLIQMFKGGIYDHIGGGFSRYSTDEKWLVPHFEKMLYDNAGLSYVYLEAYKMTKNGNYAYCAKRILDYVIKEMTRDMGGFYSSQDADSEGSEGKYYLFTPDEIIKVLGWDDGEYICKCFDIRVKGNFKGKSIPNLLKIEDDILDKITVNKTEKLLNKLYSYRLKRMNLHKDDKILTSWNSLMIVAFSKAYRVLSDNKYIEIAKSAKEFISNNLYTKDGGLYVRWREGEAAHEGNIDDYSYYAWALIELYESTFEINYLKEAERITEIMVEKFFDKEKGGFYLYSKDARLLILRPKELKDGAMPSGNSVGTNVLCKLYRLTTDIKWKKIRDLQVGFIAGNTKLSPQENSFALLSFLELLYNHT